MIISGPFFAGARQGNLHGQGLPTHYLHKRITLHKNKKSKKNRLFEEKVYGGDNFFEGTNRFGQAFKNGAGDWIS